jgi:serine/threonine-protein kinase
VDAAGRVEPIWPTAEQAPSWIAQWPATELLAGRLPPGGLKGRLVVVGLHTPDPAAGWRPTVAGERSTAALVAASAAALIHDRVLARPGWARLTAMGLLLALAAYLLLVLPRLHARSRAAVAALWAVSLFVGAHLAVVVLRTEVPVVLPLATLLAGHLAVAWVRRPAATAAPSAITPAPPALPDVLHSHLAATVPAPLMGAQAALDETRPMHRPVQRRQLGDFELLEEIGRGAMGRVHRARQLSTGDTVAVKTLALGREFNGFALQEAQQRFQREALAAGRLQHPDIVRTLATGNSEGLVWIAMELLQGHDLVRHTSDGQLLPVPVVLEVCARIAAALAHAHTHGVVHRDIKPANVMVELDAAHGRRPVVKVTDFGVARITDAARTRTGLVLGSPSYMSPEHLAGRAVDGRSDLYSLGVLLFQLLTGQLPFQGSTVAELMHAVAHVPAPEVRSLRPRLPEAVSNIVALSLEKRPELRYADGLQMAHDLRSVAAMWPPMWAPTPAQATATARGQASTTV